MSAALLAVDALAFGLAVALFVRRHLHGPRSTASKAQRRTPVQALFIDCDDCLYQNDWATANKITSAIGDYTRQIGISKAEAYALYKKHGTTLKGLVNERKIDERGAEEFLRAAHKIDYSDIAPDPALRAELEAVAAPMWVFTASTSEHAWRCLERLGLA